MKKLTILSVLFSSSLFAVLPPLGTFYDSGCENEHHSTHHTNHMFKHFKHHKEELHIACIHCKDGRNIQLYIHKTRDGEIEAFTLRGMDLGVKGKYNIINKVCK